MCFNVFRKSLFSLFPDDQEELLRSWRKLYNTGYGYFYPVHGKPFGRDKFKQSLETGKE
jgi:hydroxyacylglutathione hydrolase